MTALSYAEIRPKIRGGDLMALSYSPWHNWHDFQIQMVRSFTQSEYSHLGLILDFGARLWVVEAVEPLVRLVPLSLYAVDGFFWIPMDAPMRGEEFVHALARIGRAKYSKWQAVKAYFHLIQIGASDLVSCAEFVMECRRISNVDMGDEATPAAVIRHVGKPVWPVRGGEA